MAYRPPSKQTTEGPSVVHSIDKLLSFRDTWREPLASFSFEEIINAKYKAAQEAAEKLNADVVPLEHSEDGFHVIDKTKLSEEEILVRDAQRCLNQLAEENFEAVVPPLLKPAIFESKIATQVVDRVFEKCIEEPKFAPLYARMCRRLCEYEHEYLKGGASFRRCLITKVQTLFEEEPVRLEKKYSEEDMTSARKRKMANTQLVAQLLLCGVLARRVYSTILDQVFVQQHLPPEINVEVGAQLIEVVCTAHPEEFDLVAIKKDGQAINPFQRDRVLLPVLTRIGALSGEDRFCKRVQFKLMEILDMYNRQWALRPGVVAAKAKAAAGASGVHDGTGTVPQTPMTDPTPSSAVGTPLFPKTASAIPKKLPKIGSAERKQFVSALETATPSDAASFQKVVTEISVVIQATVPVNHMACLSCFMDKVCRSHDTDKHDDAVALICHPVWGSSEVAIAFLWTVIEGVRDAIREDCPKFFDRLAYIFANSVLVKLKTPFISVIRDLFVPAAERVGEALKNAEKEGLDEEMCAEEFVHAWESFLKGTFKIGTDNKLEFPKFPECAEWWSKAPWDGVMGEIALPDVMGAFISTGYIADDEMRKWVNSNGKNKQFKSVVGACDLVC